MLRGDQLAQKQTSMGLSYYIPYHNDSSAGLFKEAIRIEKTANVFNGAKTQGAA